MADNFLSEDKEKCIAFGQFLGQFAKWDLTTQNALALNRHLSWFNTLPAKIEAHVFEVNKIANAKEDSREPKGDLKKVK